jgi:hypothetical protein
VSTHSPHGGLVLQRARSVEVNGRAAVVVEVDATDDEHALAVLQASLHDQPPGCRLIYGYDVAAVGLGAWVGDRRIRLRVWQALLHDDGTITADDPDQAGTDVLAIDFDPTRDADALAHLQAAGRLIVAGPEAGPTPLVLDVDPDLVAEAIAGG